VIVSLENILDQTELQRLERNLATNVRLYREAAGMSQDQLAQAMAHFGFGFSQATIWKIEQGKRPIRYAEAIALHNAMGVPAGRDIAAEPSVATALLELDAANRHVTACRKHLKQAAVDYLEAQIRLACHDKPACAERVESGIPGDYADRSHLADPPEHVVIQARIERQMRDENQERVDRVVDKIIEAFRNQGVDPQRGPVRSEQVPRSASSHHEHGRPRREAH
jgi:transcriptional regulator with XRE-family HTH domain